MAFTIDKSLLQGYYLQFNKKKANNQLNFQQVHWR